MALDQEKVLSVFNQLPNELQSLVGSERNTNFNSSIINKYGIQNIKGYMEITTKVMLNMLPFSQLRKRLVEDSIVSEASIDACIKDIEQYIQPLLNYWDSGGKATTQPTQTSEKESLVQPLRTMEGDLKRIHGYGSFGDLYGSEENGEAVYKSDQDEVIKKQNLANTPTYNDSENPQ